MTEPSIQNSQPPRLTLDAQGKPQSGSLADVIEWFLNFDERTARMRHPQVEELFQWKLRDDLESGAAVYPFENAEARFAIGIAQAIEENNSEPLLKLWISDVLNALQQARETMSELTDAYKLDAKPLESAVTKADKLTTTSERRMYLTSCWFDSLFTAEARVLGWIYQELYGQPFQP